MGYRVIAAILTAFGGFLGLIVTTVLSTHEGAKGFSTTAVAASASGFLGGLLIGWWAAAWLLRRYLRHQTWTRGLMICTGLAWSASAVFTAGSTAGAILYLWMSRSDAYSAMAFDVLRNPSFAESLIAAAGTMAIAALPCRGDTAHHAGRPLRDCEARRELLGCFLHKRGVDDQSKSSLATLSASRAAGRACTSGMAAAAAGPIAERL